ncbi:MAG TPA: hypothetical protein DEA75_10390 [Rhodobacteraceae bacterium]|nr:hypothetical protein [Paracoccaceae bacterium]
MWKVPFISKMWANYRPARQKTRAYRFASGEKMSNRPIGGALQPSEADQGGSFERQVSDRTRKVGSNFFDPHVRCLSLLQAQAGR